MIEIINGEINNHKLILSDPEPMVRLGELGDSSLNFTVRVWVEAADYWTVYFDIFRKRKRSI